MIGKRIYLIGCGARKNPDAPRAGDGGYCQHHKMIRARDFYVGPLFRKRLTYALRECKGDEAAVAILSAEHWLVDLDKRLKWYDKTWSDMTQRERAEWPVFVLHGLVDSVIDYYRDEDTEAPERDLRNYTLEIHAGAKYAEPLIAHATLMGFAIDWPVQGKSQGEQMAWYARLEEEAAQAARIRAEQWAREQAEREAQRLEQNAKTERIITPQRRLFA